MRSFRRTFLAGLSGSACASGFLRYPAGAAEFTYKFGTDGPTEHPTTTYALEAAARIRSQSGGRLEVQIFPNSSLGTSASMLTQLRAGAIELQQIGDLELAAVVPLAALDGLPFMFSSYQQAHAAVDGPLGDYIRKAISKAGLYPFAKTWDSSFKQIISNRPVYKPDDLKGQKIRTAPSQVQVALFKSFGAVPVAAGFGQVYVLMQTHVADGCETGFDAIETAKFYEVGKYVALTQHTWIGKTLIANVDAWQRLPPALRDTTEKNFDQAALAARDAIVRNEAATPAKLQTQGVAVNKVDFAEFQTVVRKSGLYTQWRDDFGAEPWALLERSIGKQLA